MEQIIRTLRGAEVEIARGRKVPQVCRKLAISEQTYYRWRKEYGGLKLDQAKRLSPQAYRCRSADRHRDPEGGD